MSRPANETKYTNLGDLLRETRIKQGFDLKTVAEETKISPQTLQSIEDNDIASLPAAAFSRGFYTLYAKLLSLDTATVLQMYAEEKRKQPESEPPATPTPTILAKQVGNMAERPVGLPFSFFGLVLILLLIFGAFLCWYFSWNPATFLSEKLRGVEQPKTEQTLGINNAPIFNSPIADDNLQQPNNTDLQPISLDDSPITDQTHATDLPANCKYQVHAVFRENTEVILAVDDLPRRSLSFKKGDSTIWHANEKLAITIPTTTNASLTLNDIPLEIPHPDTPTVTLNIPEFLLQ